MLSNVISVTPLAESSMLSRFISDLLTMESIKVDFTREPIIETVITPKEGCKLVVRSSKSSGQEEYFVDAVEVVSFGSSFFFRSLERPKSFLVPSSDYEILEVREARMVLKNIGIDRSIKIGGGREVSAKAPKESQQDRVELPISAPSISTSSAEVSEDVAESPSEPVRQEKKRDRRRQHRRRRGREEALPKETDESVVEELSLEEGGSEPVEMQSETKKPASEGGSAPAAPFSTLLPPPPTLISETIARYKDNAMFKGAFFTKEEKLNEPLPESSEAAVLSESAEEQPVNPIPESAVFSEEVEPFELQETLPEIQPDLEFGDLFFKQEEASENEKQEEEPNTP